jgi:hypothetical protein
MSEEIKLTARVDLDEITTAIRNLYEEGNFLLTDIFDENELKVTVTDWIADRSIELEIKECFNRDEIEEAFSNMARNGMVEISDYFDDREIAEYVRNNLDADDLGREWMLENGPDIEQELSNVSNHEIKNILNKINETRSSVFNETMNELGWTRDEKIKAVEFWFVQSERDRYQATTREECQSNLEKSMYSLVTETSQTVSVGKIVAMPIFENPYQI